jgi:putative chitinase
MITRDLILSLASRPTNKTRREIYDAYVEALVSEETKGRLALAGINTELRLAHLLAQWLHESGGFTVLWEDMNYSASRIMQIFGVGKHSAKVTREEAESLARDGPALAERVYGLGNPKKAAELGNLEPGDGYRYRGFGIGQITGGADHKRLLGGKTTAQASINAAIQEWIEKGCNALADADNVVAVTRKINGGTNGLDDREAWLEKTKAACSGIVFGSGAPRRVPVVEAEPKREKRQNADEPVLPVDDAATGKPAPSLPSVAARSKSVWSLLNAQVLIVVGFLTDLGGSAVDFVGDLFGVLPSAADGAIAMAEKGSRLSDLIGFDWKRVALAVVVVCLVVPLVRHAFDKRELEMLRGQQS